MNRRRFLIGAGAAGAASFIGFGRLGAVGAASSAGGLYAPTVWYVIDRAGIVTVHVTKAEVGQHIGTAFAMMIAEELEADWRDIRLDYPDPRREYGILVTAGSWSVANNFDDMRRYGAAGRIALLEAAAKRWGVPVAECRAQAGRVVRGDGESVSYGELVASGAVSRVFEDDDLGAIVLKPASDWRLIGSSPPALDIPAKVTGAALYAIDLAVPGMLIGKIVRPPVRVGATLRAIDDSAAKAMRGYRGYVEAASTIVLLADDFPAAKRAEKSLKIEWDKGPNQAVSDADLLARARALTADPAQGSTFWHLGDAASAMALAERRFAAEYTTAAVAHAALEPASALAFRDGERWHVFAGSAFQTHAIAAVASALDVDNDQVSLHQTYLGDPTGNRVEVDILVAAALASKAAGRPVKLIHDREDEMRFDFPRPLAYQKLEVGLDRAGRIMGFRHDLCSAWPLARALPIALRPGVDPNVKLDWTAVVGADSWYDFENYSVRLIQNDLAQRAAPAGFLRGAASGWAIWALESFIDEIAEFTGVDAVNLRLQLLDGKGPNAGPSGGASRLAAVIERAVERSEYRRKRKETSGIGLAASAAPTRDNPSWTACVAEVSAAAETGRFSVEKLTIVTDVGTAVHRDGTYAQVESAALFGLSVALFEAIPLRGGDFQATNFDDYHMLRYGEVPPLDIEVISGGQHPTGAGEPAMSVVAPAIGNAIFHAVGARVRDLPITPEKVLAALKTRTGGTK